MMWQREASEWHLWQSERLRTQLVRNGSPGGGEAFPGAVVLLGWSKGERRRLMLA